MNLSLIWCFLIGTVLGNGFLHFNLGRSKTIAKSPFGQESELTVNLGWGLSNFVVATILSVWQVSQSTVTGSSIITLLAGF